MIWVLAVVVVGLIAVLAELLLSYQKRAHDLRLKQDPLRRRIRAHTRAMQDAASGIQQAATGQVEEFTSVVRTLAQRAEELRTELQRLERLLPEEESEDDDITEEPTPSAAESEDTPVNRWREIERLMRQEVDGNRSSLQRDIDVVQRTLTLLESKLRRGTTAEQTS